MGIEINIAQTWRNCGKCQRCVNPDGTPKDVRPHGPYYIIPNIYIGRTMPSEEAIADLEAFVEVWRSNL